MIDGSLGNLFDYSGRYFALPITLVEWVAPKESSIVNLEEDEFGDGADVNEKWLATNVFFLATFSKDTKTEGAPSYRNSIRYFEIIA